MDLNLLHHSPLNKVNKHQYPSPIIKFSTFLDETCPVSIISLRYYNVYNVAIWVSQIGTESFKKHVFRKFLR